MTVLVVVAVDAEGDAVQRGLPAGADVDVVVSGVGPVAAAVSTARGLTTGRYDAAWSVGVAGGFAGRAEVGDIVLADRVVAADVGISSPDGFVTLGELGWVETVLVPPPPVVQRAADCLAGADLTPQVGTIVTVNASTGTDERAAELARRWDPVAEAMEGYGVAWAAHTAAPRVTALELRVVCNRVGRRDRDQWDLDGALGTLAHAVAAVFDGMRA